MAFEYPEDLKYLDSHEYARVDEDENLVTVGITAFAIDQLGDIVFLELPEIGDTVEKGENFGTVESVKAVEELKSPINGEVTERNEALIEAPEQIGDDPYGDGWLIKVKAEDLEDLEDAMTAEEYKDQVEGPGRRPRIKKSLLRRGHRA
ncbi:MAG: glycine cleavage system protein GcvH [Leptolyngbyaceae cyanobacterium SM2_3_12]|nr:glycine cleavage system protein GcvH [Leptolyngbyaceae cyanobacterium SM2_3_12]